MNITINTQTLAQELRLLNHVVPTKPALPVLMNILIQADDHLTFYATDLEIGFRTSCAATVTEPGVVTLPAKRLLDIIEQLPNADVQIVTDGHHVRILSGAFKSRLQTLPAEDFPTVPDVEGETSTISGLQSLIARTRYAVTDKGKYMVAGALLTLTDTVTALVATDGKRLSIATSGRSDGAFGTAVIPAKTLDAVSALFTDALVFSRSERHLFFVSGDRLLISRTIDGQFPAYERIIPRDSDKHAVVSRSGLAAALRRVGLMAEENMAVNLNFEAGGVVITSSSAEAGDAVERVAAGYNGEPLKVCVSWRYVLDFLEAATGAEIAIDFQSATTPLLFSDGGAFINVVMVMRG